MGEPRNFRHYRVQIFSYCSMPMANRATRTGTSKEKTKIMRPSLLIPR
ncbi:hypothetical protein SAMN05660745_00481 [Corynebacterium glucuronolyticum]|nr:hypothetical protein CGLUCO_01625 [Corynebacterium glucuronolyticum DSM 44120]SMB77975.1 hypothetical protein SAMN05660745_00481 [Corynebacterium glucuronolyticum]